MPGIRKEGFRQFPRMILAASIHDNKPKPSIVFKRTERTDLNQFTQILKDRLERKGLVSEEITGYIRDLTNVLIVNPHSNHLYLNEQLHLLGWGDLELDYRTFEIATASFEGGD